MTFEIKSWRDGHLIYSCEAETLCEAVGQAVAAGVRLQDASLPNADLRGAFLQDAFLPDALLRGSDLRGSVLRGAFLQNTDLRGAFLQNADLRRSFLQYADIRGSFLEHAKLQNADLRDAAWRDAAFGGADLRGAKGVSRERCTPLLHLLDQPGLIRLYKLVNATGEGPYNGGIVYEIGKSYSVDDADEDERWQCAAGLSVADLVWCMQGWQDGYRILIVEFTAADIACIPTANDGKLRLHRMTVVGEKNLTELGLIEPNSTTAPAEQQKGGSHD